MLAEPLLSVPLVRALLLALELALPMEEPLQIDVFQNGSFQTAVVIAEDANSYTVRRVVQGGQGRASSAGPLLFVAEPSEEYAHIYTLFGDAEAASASGQPGAGSGQVTGTGSGAAGQADGQGAGNAQGMAASGPASFPTVIDVGSSVTALTSGAPAGSSSNAPAGSYRMLERGSVRYLEAAGSGLLLVIHSGR